MSVEGVMLEGSGVMRKLRRGTEPVKLMTHENCGRRFPWNGEECANKRPHLSLKTNIKPVCKVSDGELPSCSLAQGGFDDSTLFHGGLRNSTCSEIMGEGMWKRFQEHFVVIGAMHNLRRIDDGNHKEDIDEDTNCHGRGFG